LNNLCGAELPCPFFLSSNAKHPSAVVVVALLYLHEGKGSNGNEHFYYDETLREKKRSAPVPMATARSPDGRADQTFSPSESMQVVSAGRPIGGNMSTCRAVAVERPSSAQLKEVAKFHQSSVNRHVVQ
jgi:hypothetical protein